MSFICRPIEFDLGNENLGVSFLLKKGTEDCYDILSQFTEDDTHYILYNGSHEYKIEKDQVEKHSFYELGKECWECEKHCPFTEVVYGDGIHYSGTGKELKRKRDFCSNECLTKYVENPENEFTLIS